MGQLCDEVAGLTTDTVVENKIAEGRYPKQGHYPDNGDRDHQLDQREACSGYTMSGKEPVIRSPDIQVSQTGVVYSVS